MGRELYERFDEARAVYSEAKSATGVDWAEISFEADAETLSRTENTQPCLFLNGVAIVRSLGEKADYEGVAGHSLGEYTALHIAGVLKFREALQAVIERGKLMSQAKSGGMIVPLGLDAKTIEDIVESLSAEGVIAVANLNAPGQIVVSGEESILDAATEKFVEGGAKRVVRLPVSGAFHSPLMEESGREMRKILEKVDFSSPGVPFYANVSGDREDNPDNIRGLLIDQITNPVRWIDLVKKMTEDGFDNYIEAGPGKVLRGLIKRISREVEMSGLSDVESIENYCKDLG
jgi:[acyl-carrier-protein] S-malonyltransferase